MRVKEAEPYNYKSWNFRKVLYKKVGFKDRGRIKEEKIKTNYCRYFWLNVRRHDWEWVGEIMFPIYEWISGLL